VFKHFKVSPSGDWRQNKKQGDVQEIFVRKSIFIMAQNYNRLRK
jgi:hypothetical protein